MRLTIKRNGKHVIPLLMAVCGLNLPYWRIDRPDDLHGFLSGDAADKLAAYEDTGLTPEECATIAKSYPRLFDMVYELQKYKDAEADGRLVILPCKVGDTVYRITKSGAILDELVDDIVMPEFYTRTQDGLRGLDAMWNEFGKAVFLTREEAEAVLKGETSNEQ